MVQGVSTLNMIPHIGMWCSEHCLAGCSELPPVLPS